MVQIHLSNEDLVQTHFAFSPLWEVMTSYRVLVTPSRHALYLPWIKEAQSALRGVDLSYMDILIPPEGYVPDFLTPTPESPTPSFDEELDRVRTTPPEIVRKHALSAVYWQEMPRASLAAFLNKPQEAVKRLAATIRVYWDRALSQHWPRIQAVLESDVLFRSRQLAMEGPVGLFSNLHPTASFDRGVLRIEKPFSAEVKSTGRGVVLVPALFSWPRLYLILEEMWRPTIGYAPRGAGLWLGVSESPDEALALALGEARASVVQALDVPRNTGELAEALSLTPGAVSQHLGRLKKAGLVEPLRQGRMVFYRLTNRGEAMLRVFGARAIPQPAPPF